MRTSQPLPAGGEPPSGGSRAQLLALSGLATPEGSESFLRETASSGDSLQTLTAPPPEERIALGYGHTLREIAQQPFVWAHTALLALPWLTSEVAPLLGRGVRSIVFCGSGSSHYVGELVAPVLRARLGMPVVAAPAGDLLTHGRLALPVPGPVLLVSVARSGNSPESLAAVRIAAAEAPDTVFLHIVCNAEGRLAEQAFHRPAARCLRLHPQANDRSLVMTSSFTSMALAALAIGYTDSPDAYLEQTARLCGDVRAGFASRFTFARSFEYAACRRAVFLGSGAQFGAAREAALKLTEMTAGAIVAMAETHLGLRHGPMAAIHPDTLIVSLHPAEPHAARYADDLLAELRAKELGFTTVVHAPGQPPAIFAAKDVPPAPPAIPLEPGFAAIEQVAFAQLIGFCACRTHGLAPDAPSRAGVITRVVPPFPIYDGQPEPFDAH